MLSNGLFLAGVGHMLAIGDGMARKFRAVAGYTLNFYFNRVGRNGVVEELCLIEKR